MLTSSREFDTTDALVEEYLAYRGFVDVRKHVCVAWILQTAGGLAHTPRHGFCSTLLQALSGLRREAAADRLGKYNVDAFIDRIRVLLGRLGRCMCPK